MGGYPCLGSILRMGMCPVSLGKSCVTVSLKNAPKLVNCKFAKCYIWLYYRAAHTLFTITVPFGPKYNNFAGPN